MYGFHLTQDRSRIIDEAQITHTDYIGCLLNAITDMNFKAAAMLLIVVPEGLHLKYHVRWDPPGNIFYGMDIKGTPNRLAENRPRTVAQKILSTGSYDQCRFVLGHLLTQRSSGIGYHQQNGWSRVLRWWQFRSIRRPTNGEESVPEWYRCPLDSTEYDALLTGNIIRNRPDRKALWNVVVAQISTGHSISVDHLKLAVDCSNTEALREMLDIGCAVNGSWRDYTTTPLQHALGIHSRCEDMMEELLYRRSFSPSQQDMLMDLHGMDGPPSLRDPDLQTHSEIYSKYSGIRQEQFVNLYMQKLSEAITILREHGGRISPFSFVTERVTLEAWKTILHALLYAGFLPNVLVSATQASWQQATTGQKFAFAYLWALTSYSIPPVLHSASLLRWVERSTRIALLTLYPAIFLFNHIVLPYVVIGHGWRPFQSCDYFAEDDQLGSTCVDYTFLLPLAVAGVEMAILSVVFFYEIQISA